MGLQDRWAIVLVDAGTGQLFGPGYGGKLVQSLAAADIKPEEVTDILITHIHPDHSGGLLQDGKMVFPRATIHVAHPDLTFFMDRSNAAKSHVDIKYIDEAVQTFRPYLDAGKVAVFDQSTELMRGVTATVHPGHTPGSAFYPLQSGSQSVLFVGDVIHVCSVQISGPNHRYHLRRRPESRRATT